jgi:paraquat-inducible protein B
VWVVPLVAAAVGAWVAVTRILAEGPKITIVFQSAEGLEAGKTKIRYNGVDVGTLTTIQLSDDHKRVIATAQMAPKTDDLLLDDTKFWVVRPRISGATITGLGTLISGAYIGVEIGRSRDERRDFVALGEPPVVSAEVPGRSFILKTTDLGSVDKGTPVFFRRLQVGEITSYILDQDGQNFTVEAFINAPYDKHVTPDTRFWHASGIDVSLSASGFEVQTESLLSILVGGIAFETPASGPALPAAEAKTVFTLFRDRAGAFRPAARDPLTYVLRFKESVRGLVPGAPVSLRGIQIGEIAEIDAQIDAKTFEFSVPVIVRLEATRFGVKVVDLAPGEDVVTARRKLIDSQVAHGLRAQLQTGSLLTGELFVALDFFPDAPQATIDWSQTPPEIPTIPGAFQGIEASAASILKKIDQLPLKAIGDDVRKALVDLDHTLVEARTTLGSADRLIEPNSLLSQELGTTLQEVSRAARGLRVLADYLERHPEALIRGKTGGTQ